MRTPLRLLAAATAAFALAAPGSAPAAQTLAPGGSAEFPARSFVLTPERPVAIDVSRAVVTENGVPVPGARLESVGSRGGRSAVVLVIDTSESMRGEPIRRAFEAARGLAARRPAGQRLGVVLFNARAAVRLAPTDDGARIDAALAAPPRLLGGTRIFDGVDLALRSLQAARVSTGSIVVLSDGNDTGSAVTGPVLAARARRSGTRIFTVGLRSSQFDPAALEALAAAGGGRFSEASSAGQLRGIFDTLGARFAREYVLTYRSVASARTRVDVSLTAPGLQGGATASYVAPAGAGTRRVAADDDGFWARDGAVAIVSIALGLLVGIGALAMLGLRSRARRSVPARIAAFGAPASAPLDDLTGSAARPSVLSGLSWWAAFEEEVDVAQLERTPSNIMALGAGGGTAVGLLLAVAVGSPVFLLLAGVGVLVARSLVIRAADGKRKDFEAQLIDTLQGTASALRAGHSVQSALAEVTADAAEPTKRELGGALADERLGKPLDDALRDVARRLRNRDVEQIALVSELQRSTGANMAEVLDRVADTVRDRQDLQRTIQALTAQGRMARGVLSALPPGLLAVLAAINPDYISPLFDEPLGIVALVLAILMTVAGSLTIKKIVAIEA